MKMKLTMNMMKNSGKMFPCCKCDFLFMTEAGLKYNMDIHTKEKHPNVICGECDFF